MANEVQHEIIVSCHEMTILCHNIMHFSAFYGYRLFTISNKNIKSKELFEEDAFLWLLFVIFAKDNASYEELS